MYVYIYHLVSSAVPSYTGGAGEQGIVQKNYKIGYQSN